MKTEETEAQDLPPNYTPKVLPKKEIPRIQLPPPFTPTPQSGTPTKPSSSEDDEKPTET